MLAPPAALLMLVTSLAACSPGTPEAEREDARSGMGMMDGGSRGGMMEGSARDGMGMMGDMMTIRQLLARHEQVQREAENVPGGVRTVTVSDEPEVTELIRQHVREMKARYGRDQPIRMMDPVFRELYRHRDRATLEIEDIPGGVRVLHTSDDPEVTALIRQHAHAFVSEAVEQGMQRAMEPTALPENYIREEEGAGR